MMQTKALYNLLRLNAAENDSVEAEEWALENFRVTPIEELFKRLEESGVKLDRGSFFHFAEDCDTPEELTDLLLPDEAYEKARDSFYLVVFELWRRLLPEKQSLSIFCDELDHRISLYDQGEMESDELVQDALANLLEVLDQNADSGADPEEIFQAISEYCAHDIESFIFDYISDLLDSGSSLYASELMEGFSPYVSDPLWIDFLRIRLISFTDIGDANLAMHRLLENDLDMALLLEILRFLSASGEHELFKMAIQKTIPLVKTQEEWADMLTFIADFYRLLDEDEKEKAVQKLLVRCKTGPIHRSDLIALQELMSQ